MYERIVRGYTKIEVYDKIKQNIHTTGDSGETSLVNGNELLNTPQTFSPERSMKPIQRLVSPALYRRECGADKMLARVQNDLFDLGADIATPETDKPALRITAEQVERLESEIDIMNAELTPLDSFILPGGSAASAWLHLARTVTRRAERHLTELANKEAINSDNEICEQALRSPVCFSPKIE